MSSGGSRLGGVRSNLFLCNTEGVSPTGGQVDAWCAAFRSALTALGLGIVVTTGVTKTLLLLTETHNHRVCIQPIADVGLARASKRGA